MPDSRSSLANYNIARPASALFFCAENFDDKRRHFVLANIRHRQKDYKVIFFIFPRSDVGAALHVGLLVLVYVVQTCACNFLSLAYSLELDATLTRMASACMYQ